jgi:hypothetical protein
MRATRLQELEDMATRLLATVRQIRPGQERHDVLEQIGKIRLQIAALKGSDLRPAQMELKAEEMTFATHPERQFMQYFASGRLDQSAYAASERANCGKTAAKRLDRTARTRPKKRGLLSFDRNGLGGQEVARSQRKDKGEWSSGAEGEGDEDLE